ncbi:TonB-dependent receptor [Gammaproteobacteria bacterium]|nr:TonB-dependent receptor [Gammaproteobacteria bacterium]
MDLSVSAYESKSDDYFFEHTDGPASDGKDFTTTNNVENTSELKLFNTSLIVEHEFANGYTLTSTTAYLDDEMDFTADIEATPNPVVDITSHIAAEYYSQELRLASPADRDYDFVAGLYYDDEESETPDVIFAGAGFPFPPIQNSSINRGGNTFDRTSWAAFIHANFDLNEKTTLFGGLRYTDEVKEQQTHPSTCVNFFTCIILGNPALTTTTDAPVDVELQEWTWTAGMRYQLNQDVMIYGSIGTGTKSGAMNSTANPAADFAANNLVTDHEEVTSYELGIKSSWLDSKLNVNFALFSMDYDDLQVRLGCETCGPGGIPQRFLSNAGTATSEGFELDMIAYPTESLRFTLGVGYVDSTYDKLEGVEDPRRGGGFFDASGNTIALAADWTINASVQHTAYLRGGELTSRLDLNFIDERYSDGSFHNNSNDLLPSQTLLNGRLSYRPAEDNWGVSLWVRNLTDDDSETYVAFGAAFLPFGTNRAQYQEPRTYGVTLNLSF